MLGGDRGRGYMLGGDRGGDGATCWEGTGAGLHAGRGACLSDRDVQY